MQYLTAIAALSAAFATTSATSHSDGEIVARGENVDSAPAECNFSDVEHFVETNHQGNNWCIRGYYAEDNINCDDWSAGTGWAPPFYTQEDHPYCECHSFDPDSPGRYPLSVGIWFKGNNNPQQLSFFTSDVPNDDGRCYSYRWQDGTMQGNNAIAEWQAPAVQFTCVWLNHTNVPEEFKGFASKKYVNNPQCPYS